MTLSQITDLRLMAEAIVRKRLTAMFHDHDRELGGGGPSLENLIWIAAAVVIALGAAAWLTIKITSKENTVNP